MKFSSSLPSSFVSLVLLLLLLLLLFLLLLLLLLLLLQGSYALENPWILRVHFQVFKALKILENLCSSFLVLESPWIFLWPAFLIFENFSENNQPLKSCHTNATSCGVENGYQCLCLIFMHVRYRKWGPWNFKIWPLKVLEKSLNFWSKKVCKPCYHHHHHHYCCYYSVFSVCTCPCNVLVWNIFARSPSILIIDFNVYLLPQNSQGHGS